MIPTIYFLVDMIDGRGNPPHPPLFVRLIDIDLLFNVLDVLDVLDFILRILDFVLVFFLGIIISREKIDRMLRFIIFYFKYF